MSRLPLSKTSTRAVLAPTFKLAKTIVPPRPSSPVPPLAIRVALPTVEVSWKLIEP